MQVHVYTICVTTDKPERSKLSDIKYGRNEKIRRVASSSEGVFLRLICLVICRKRTHYTACLYVCTYIHV